MAAMGAAAKQYIAKHFMLSEKILELENHLIGIANKSTSGDR